jgi:hypothetical protein
MTDPGHHASYPPKIPKVVTPSVGPGPHLEPKAPADQPTALRDFGGTTVRCQPAVRAGAGAIVANEESGMFAVCNPHGAADVPKGSGADAVRKPHGADAFPEESAGFAPKRQERGAHVFRVLRNRLGTSRARIDLPVLEGQITIGTGGSKLLDKPARPAPCCHGPPQPRDAEARPHTNKNLSRPFRSL